MQEATPRMTPSRFGSSSRLSSSAYTLGAALQQGLALITGVLIARELGTEGYGLTSVIRNFTQFVLVVAPLGLDLALLKIAAQSRSLAAYIRLRSVVFIFNVSLAAALAVLSPWLLSGGAYDHPSFAFLLLCALLSIPFSADFAIIATLGKASNNPVPAILASLYIQPIIRAVLIFTSIAFDFGLIGVVAANTISAIFAHLLLLVITKREFHALEVLEAPAQLWPALKLGAAMILSLLAYNVMRLTDVLVLGAFATPAVLGSYALLAAFAQLITIFPVALSQTLGPNIARAHADGNIDLMRLHIANYIRSASWLTGYVFGGIAIFSPSVGQIIGASFIIEKDLSIILCFGYFVSATLAPTGYALSMTGHYRRERYILIAGATLLLPLCVLITSLFGAIGAAGAVVFCFSFVNSVRFAMIERLHDIKFRKLSIFVPPFLALILAALLQYAGQAMIHGAVFSLIFGGSFYTIFFACFAYMFGLVPGERHFVQSLISRVVRRWESK